MHRKVRTQIIRSDHRFTACIKRIIKCQEGLREGMEPLPSLI